MALIRGTKSKFPCPICLVPDTQMSDGSTHPLRTSEDMQKVYEEADAMPSGECEEHLKMHGLRYVKVWKSVRLWCFTEFYTTQSVFWNLGNSDPYRALSFDRLHTNNLGMFGDHLWKTIKQIVKVEGRLALGILEDMYSS